jgi:DNA-binding transcriptional MerR regulator
MQGWTNINQFKKATGVPYSLETVRRAFNECPYKNLDTITLAIIMKHLNYSPKEIKTILGKHLDPNDPVLELISDRSENKLTISEEKLIEAYRAITEKLPELSNSLADHLDLLGKIANVPTRQVTDALRR